MLFLAYCGWKRVDEPWGDQRVAFRPANQDCASTGAMRYCIYRDSRGTNGDVLYYLHGRNLDENVWNDDTYFTALLQAEWQRLGLAAPTVVALSYGRSWLLTTKGQRAESGMIEDLMAHIPEIEGKLGKPNHRLLMGESMGGLNALVLGLSQPTAFERVAALCPGLYSVSPFAPLAQISQAITGTGASPKIAFGVWLMARHYLADEAEWQRMSPLSLIEQADANYPALYLSCGLYDAYGNFEGLQRLMERAAIRGVETEWHPLYGGHCAIDIPSLARFLAS